MCRWVGGGVCVCVFVCVRVSEARERERENARERERERERERKLCVCERLTHCPSRLSFLPSLSPSTHAGSERVAKQMS